MIFGSMEMIMMLVCCLVMGVVTLYMCFANRVDCIGKMSGLNMRTRV